MRLVIVLAGAIAVFCTACYGVTPDREHYRITGVSCLVLPDDKVVSCTDLLH